MDSWSKRLLDFLSLGREADRATGKEYLSELESELQFMDDLVAANRFKTFLLGTGVDVPEQTSQALAGLVATYIDHTKDDSQTPGFSSDISGLSAQR